MSFVFLPRFFIIIFTFSHLLFDSSSAYYTYIYQRKCFYHNKIPMGFFPSRIDCIQNKYQFASIENIKELEFLEKLIGRINIWVGLMMNTTDNKWYWENGKELSNLTWIGAHPNYNYGYIKGTGILTRKKDYKMSHLCEREARPVYWPIVNAPIASYCGVEIFSNCNGESCSELCSLNPDCQIYAQMSNLCINVKESKELKECNIPMKLGWKLFRKGWGC